MVLQGTFYMSSLGLMKHILRIVGAYKLNTVYRPTDISRKII